MTADSRIALDQALGGDWEIIDALQTCPLLIDTCLQQAVGM